MIFARLNVGINSRDARGARLASLSSHRLPIVTLYRILTTPCRGRLGAGLSALLPAPDLWAREGRSAPTSERAERSGRTTKHDPERCLVATCCRRRRHRENTQGRNPIHHVLPLDMLLSSLAPSRTIEETGRSWCLEGMPRIARDQSGWKLDTAPRSPRGRRSAVVAVVHGSGSAGRGCTAALRHV